MLVFTGIYERTIDGKQRIAIPADIRGMLTEEHVRSAGPSSDSQSDSKPSIHLYISLGEGQALCIYTQEVFNKRAEELDASEANTDSLFEYERITYSLSRRVELDKQGRIRIPENLMGLSELSNDVVLLGVKDHLEIRNRDEWESYLQQVLKDPKMFKNPRRMKK